jgi:hypothetical protein
MGGAPHGSGPLTPGLVKARARGRPHHPARLAAPSATAAAGHRHPPPHIRHLRPALILSAPRQSLTCLYPPREAAIGTLPSPLLPALRHLTLLLCQVPLSHVRAPRSSRPRACCVREPGHRAEDLFWSVAPRFFLLHRCLPIASRLRPPSGPKAASPSSSYAPWCSPMTPPAPSTAPPACHYELHRSTSCCCGAHSMVSPSLPERPK